MKVSVESVKSLRKDKGCAPPCASVNLDFIGATHTFLADEEGKNHEWDDPQPILLRGLGEITSRPELHVKVTDANNDGVFLGEATLSVRDLVEDKGMAKKLKLESSSAHPDHPGRGTISLNVHWWRALHDNVDGEDLQMVQVPNDEDVSGSLDVTNSLTGVLKEISKLLMKLGDEANLSLPVATIGLMKMLYSQTTEDLIRPPPESRDIDIDLDVMGELCFYMRYATAAYGAKETQKEIDGKEARKKKEDKLWAKYAEEARVKNIGGGELSAKQITEAAGDDEDDEDPSNDVSAGPSLAMVELSSYIGTGIIPKATPEEISRKHAEVIARYLGSDPEDIVASRWTYKPFLPAWFIAREPRRKTVVLSIRGTNSVHDAITDALASTQDFYGGSGHKGMIASAHAVLNECLPALLKEVAASGYTTVAITGHSLGAGTAACAARILKECHDLRDIDLRCYAFACPAVVSAAVRDEMAPYTISVVHSTDVVPRLSYNSIKELNSRIHSLGLRQWSAVKDSVDEVLKQTSEGTKIALGGAAIGVASTYLNIGKTFLRQTVQRKSYLAERDEIRAENRRRRAAGLLTVQEDTLRQLQDKAKSMKEAENARRDAVRHAQQREREAKTEVDLGPPGRIHLIHTLPPRHISSMRVHDRRLAVLRQKLLDNELTWSRFQRLVIRDFSRPVYGVWEVTAVDRIVLDFHMIMDHLVSPYEQALDSIAEEFGVTSVGIQYRDVMYVNERMRKMEHMAPGQEVEG